MIDKNWILTENPVISFENTSVGRMKKEVWDASEEEINRILKEDFEIPSPSELTKPNCYIQTTPRYLVKQKRKINDIVFVPIGCTENHGDHCPSGHDTFQVTQFLEGVRRYTAKKGYEVNLAYPGLLYGGHPYHHIGMPGTVIMPQEVVVETIIAIMLGLWEDGFRKIILVNNHGHLWNLVTGIQEFCKRYQLPGIYQVFDWHRSIREFFYPNNGKPNCMETNFVHADESETSLGLLMFPEMINMDYAVDTKPVNYLNTGWFDTSVDDFRRPHRWDEGEGHSAIEFHGTPQGVVGTSTIASAEKAKRPIVAICRLLSLLVEEILEKFPAGKVPPADGMTFRTPEEIAPYLLEPLSPGWKSVYSLPRIGPVEKK
jgi:creatinine amidohydrolase/Fe(II)-dependent formamide hydrolase-like protein